MNLAMGPMILGHRRPRKPTEQGCRSSDVLACPDEVWEGFIVLDDPPVHVMGHDARAPTVSMALDLSIELRTFLLKLESCFLELLVLGLQLLHPQARQGRCISPTSTSRSFVGVAYSSWVLSSCPLGVPTMKHSREG